MKYYFYVLLIWLVVFSVSCFRSDKTGEYKSFMNSSFNEVEEVCFDSILEPIRIDVSGKSLDKDIPIDITYIQLETPLNSLIAQIDRILFDEGKIFILDKKMSCVHIFKNDGTFLHCINSIGSGPGEYNKLMDMSLDVENKRIVLWDATKKSFFDFDYDGAFISSRRLQLWSREFIVSKTGDYYLFTNNGNGTGFRVLIADSIGFKKAIPYNQYYKLNYYERSPVLKYYNDHILCSFPFCNTIFSINNYKLASKYELVPKDKFFLYNPEMHPDYKTFATARMASSNQYVFLGGASESDDFLIMPINTNRKYGFIVYCKNTKETLLGGIKIPDTDFHLSSPLSVFNNKFVTFIYPFQILKFNQLLLKYPIFSGVKENDNPWLVFYSLK
ncbi:6-bladed beta-propeller [Geofilum sp. OHC36d9]|uniref:6-bladed beta-propeller n=1 Tax=Geofilum sp. OHC36d9 TaxID=3458413 RepID=UPI0040336EB8